jgi:hypothetical protein
MQRACSSGNPDEAAPPFFSLRCSIVATFVIAVAACPRESSPHCRPRCAHHLHCPAVVQLDLQVTNYTNKYGDFTTRTFNGMLPGPLLRMEVMLVIAVHTLCRDLIGVCL